MKFGFLALMGTFSLLLIISGTRAQDSLYYNESLTGIKQFYFDGIGDNAQIYHGREFIRSGQKTAGFPFYDSNNLMRASVYYQGMLYSDRYIYYNLVSDELVSGNYAQNAFIALSPEKADSFRFGTHFFLHLAAVNINGINREGYFELLVAGQPGLYVKREKRIDPGSGSIESRYIQNNIYLIKNGETYHVIDGKKALLELFSDRKDDLKKYIRTNKLNFKKNLESSLMLTTVYYSRLKY